MDPFALIIFGITSNLAQLKLIPALYDLEEKGLLPAKMTIIGIARGQKSPEEFQNYFHEVLHRENRHHHHGIKPEIFKRLTSHLIYLQGDIESTSDNDVYLRLKKLLESKGDPCLNHLYYLATYPQLYPTIFTSLKQVGLNSHDCGWVRLMIEKPLGFNLSSARQLDELLHQFFSEEQIFRLDHYLGKETLQNILTFRFSNEIFKPLMNRDFVDHIQITAAENFGIGSRGGYYDTMGALRDVGQNHLLQMLSLVTMAEPKEFSNPAVTKDRLKILKALKPQPDKIIFGQYSGYQNEKNIAPNSQTETFFALRTHINNDQWHGVPIYIRAGKHLAQFITEISVIFKTPQSHLFSHLDKGLNPNVLVFRIQPNEGIGLQILTKKPGYQFQLDTDFMQYCYPGSQNAMPDAYEKLFYDALVGDQTFFNDADEVEAEWSFTDELLKHKSTPIIYQPGTWGPPEADQLIENDGRFWLPPSNQFCYLPAK